MATTSTPDRDVTEALNIPEQVGVFVRARDREHAANTYVYENAGTRTSRDGNDPIDGVKIDRHPSYGWRVHVLRWSFSAEALVTLSTLPVSFDARRIAVAVAKDMMDAATIADQDTTDAMETYQLSLADETADQEDTA